MVAETAIFFCTFSNFISKDMLRWSNITETLLIVRLEGSNKQRQPEKKLAGPTLISFCYVR